MFRGIQQINLDAKYRLAIPTRYRQMLNDVCSARLIITVDTEQRCLLMYPMPSWLEIEAKIAKLPSFNPAARRIQRLLMGHATEVDMDSNGRVLIPPALREYAELDKKAALVGQGNKFEVWSEPLWQACREHWLQEEMVTDEDLPEDMKSLSI